MFRRGTKGKEKDRGINLGDLVRNKNEKTKE